LFKIDNLIEDLQLVRRIYSSVLAVESVNDPVIHLLADQLFGTEVAAAPKTVHVIYDTRRQWIMEISHEGATSQLPYIVLISTCSLSMLPATSGDQDLERSEILREKVLSLGRQTTRVVLNDYVTFLRDFPAAYCKLSKGILQAHMKLAPGDLLRITLGLMNQVAHFEILGD
jgi:hypothetical protein